MPFKTSAREGYGIYANFSDATVPQLIETLIPIFDKHEYIVCRDAMHGPQTLFGILNLLTQNQLHIRTAYIVGHQILEENHRVYTHPEITTTLSSSNIKNWPKVDYLISGERSYTEVVPTYHEMQRVVYSKNCTCYFIPILHLTNVIYGIWVIQRPGSKVYNLSSTVGNKIGDFYYNKDGVLGKLFTAAEKNVYDGAFHGQKISMLSNKLPLTEVTSVQPVTRDLRAPISCSTKFFKNQLPQWAQN